MDLRSSMILANMMSDNSGNDIQFKNYIYALNNGYIDTGINSGITSIRIKGKWLKSSYSSSTQIYFFGNLSQQSIAGGTYRTGVLGFGRYESNRVTTFLNSYSNTSGTTSTAKQYNSEQSSSDITIPSFDITQDRVYFASGNSFRILGSRNVGSTMCSNDTFGIELVEFYNNGELVNQFKPAIVNNEHGMYDTVTQTFLGNANSVGSLICE